MQIYHLATIALICVSQVFCSLSWTNCGAPEDLLTLQSLTYSPENPVRGQMLNISASGLLKESIGKGSKVNLIVKWGFVRLPVPPVDLCKTLDETDAAYKCPVQAGQFKIDQGFMLPADIPDGQFDVNLRIKDQNTRQVACLQIKLVL